MDDFSVDDPGSLLLYFPPTFDQVGDTVTTTVDGASILGGQRSITHTLNEAASAGSVSHSVSGSEFGLAQPPNLASTVVIQWDGADDLATLDPTGLGGVDLTNGGMFDVIIIGVSSLDAPLDLAVNIFTDGGNASRYAFTLPGSVSTLTDIVIPLSSFSTVAGTGADFTNVGAMTLYMRGSAVDLNIDYIKFGGSLFSAKSDALATDNNGNNLVNAGDTLTYTVVITDRADILNGNSAGVVFTDTLDLHTTLETGSVSASSGSVTQGNAGGDEIVEVNVGTLVDTEQVTITFRAVVTNPIPGGVFTLSNQGLINSASLTNYPTDDPDTAAAGDTTKTGLDTSLALAPVLIDHLPLTNTVAATLTSSVALTYSQEMSAATVTSRTVAVHSMMRGLITETHSVNGSVVTVNPSRDFFPGELVYAVATTGTVSITGTNPLVPTQWQFIAGSVTNRCVGSFSEISAGLTGVDNSSVAWGDYDNDGDLDILLTGRDGGDFFGTFATTIYRNDGGGGFSEISAGLTGVYIGSVAWGDYDNDGDLDILLTGHDGNSNPIATIYRNNGGGSFSEISAGLTGVVNSSAAWGDYDNDGDLDILLTGSAVGSTRIATIYRNDGGGGFSEISAGLTGVVSSSAVWGDYDNDGDLDILLTGRDGSSNRIATIYRNNGDNTFTDISAGLTGVDNSSAAWGDYDNDGDLDILLTGRDGSSNRIATIYRNDGGGFSDISAGLTRVEAGSAAWGDYDNDGDLDILLTGINGSNRIATIYRNDDCFPDVSIGKSVLPTRAKPGDTITYTLSFSNAGKAAATGVVITDSVPFSVTNPSVADNSGAVITLTGTAPNFVWDVANLSPNESGIITVTGQLSDSLPAGSFTNTAEIGTALVESDFTNNSAAAAVSHCGASVTVTGIADSGPGSLRQSISDLCPGGGTIDFAGNVSGTITLGGTELAITKTMVISGPGANLLAVSGNNASRVFNITGGQVTIRGLTIKDGNPGANNGGGILITTPAVVTISHSAIMSNSLPSDSSLWGAGIYSYGDLTLIRSTVSGNDAADNFGGGLYLDTPATASIIGSTFSGNSADVGGGIFVNDSSANINGATVISNTANQDDGGITVDVGGVITLTNSIVAGNIDADNVDYYPDVDEFDGNINSGGYNIIGIDDDSFISGDGATGDQTGSSGSPIEAKLGPLADNGGGTPTHALQGGSPALDAIPEGGNSYNGAPATDQRGQTRPGTFTTFSDSGAVEAQGVWTDLAISKSVEPAAAPAGDLITYTLVFSNAGSLAAAKNVVITDIVPISVTGVSYSSGGVSIVARPGMTYTWAVSDIIGGQGGIITLTGVLSNPLIPGTFTNTATITTTSVDSDTTNNTDSAGFAVVTRPAMQGIKPISNSLGVTVTTTVVITYDQSIDASSVASRTVVVQGMQSGLVTATHSAAGANVTVTPVDPFFPGELVWVSATDGVNRGGVAAEAYQWQFTTAAMSASGTFSATGDTFDINASSIGLAIGDVDGDDDLDIAVGNYSGQNVVYLNNGDGSYAATGNNFGTGTDGTFSLALGDVDGDGDLDVAVGNRGGQNVVYLNNGDGSYAATGNNFGTGSDATYSVPLGDVDGDGDLDVVVGNNGGQNVVYLNNGDGSYAAFGNNFGTGTDDTRSVVPADVDGDGDLDAAVGNNGGQNVVYLNNGDGTFAAGGNNFGPSDDNTARVALGDVDGDSDLDVAVGNNGGLNVAYLNNGDGTFAATGNSIGTILNTEETASIALGDMDGDGDLDAAVGNSSLRNAVYFNLPRTPEIDVLGQGQSITSGDSTPAVGDDTDFGSMAVGDPATHVFTISNMGTLSLTLSSTPAVTLTNGTAFTVTQPASTTLEVNQTTPFSVSFNPQGAGRFTDTVTIVNDDSDENPYTFVISGTGLMPALTIGKAAQAAPGISAAEFHSLITYTVTLTNSGNGNGAGTLLTDTLPAEVDFARFISPPTPGDAAESGDVISWSGTVTANSSITFSYVVTHVGNHSDSISNSVQFLHATTGQSGTVSSTVTIAGPPDVSLLKQVTPGSAQPGQAVTYTLSFSNSNNPATDVVITDSVPLSLTGVTVVSRTTFGGAIVDSGAVPAYVWTVSDMAAGAGGTITITGVLSDPLGAGTFTNTATISAPGDISAGNNRSTAGITVGNMAPVAGDDSHAAIEGVAVHKTLSATDANGDTLTFAISTPPVTGSVVISNAVTGGFVYTPANQMASYVDTFTFVVTDSGNLTDSGTVTVTVLADNDAPTVTDDSVSTSETITATGTITAGDPDSGDTLSYGISRRPTYGSAAINESSGLWSYAPANRSANYSITFTVTVTDSGNLTDSGTVTITVTADNDAPTVTDDSVSTSETITATGTITAADPDSGDMLSYGISSRPTYGSAAINESSGLWSYMPANRSANYSITFTVTVTDSGNLTDSGTVTVAVTADNDAPTVTDDSVSTGETITATGTITAGDPDSGDTLSYGISRRPTYGSAAINESSGLWSYTPVNRSANYSITFTVTVTDSGNLTDSGTVTVAVTADNDAPTVSDDSVSTSETITATGTITAGDPDSGDTLSYGISRQPMYGSAAINESSGLWSYAPANRGADYSITFTVTVTDTADNSDSGTVTITVTAENGVPTLNTISNLPLLENAGVQTVTLSGISAGGDTGQTLAVTAVSTNTSLVPNPAVSYSNPDATGSLSFAPVANQTGEATVRVTVSDGISSTARSFQVTVSPPNQAPVAVDDAYVTVAGQAMTMTVLSNDTDPDGDTLTVSAVGQGSDGTVVNNSSSVIYSPAGSFLGTDAFTYTTSDGVERDTAVVTVAVVDGDSATPIDSTQGGVITVDSHLQSGKFLSTTIEFPPGSVPGSTTMVFTENACGNPAAPASYYFAGLCFSLDAYVGAGHQSNFTFSQPVTLTFYINRVRRPALRYWDGADWSTNGITVIENSRDKVVVTIDHLTDFALLSPLEPIYLPLIVKGAVFGPDLVVDSVVASGDAVAVVIRNAGNQQVAKAFWVDVYFNPTETPALNKPWPAIAPAGAVWGVTVAIPAGETLTLTTGDAYYFGPPDSSAGFPLGATVYAFVDSVNHSTSYGNVEESDEGNNLSVPVMSIPGTGSAAVGTQGTAPSREGLPGRE